MTAKYSWHSSDQTPAPSDGHKTNQPLESSLVVVLRTTYTANLTFPPTSRLHTLHQPSVTRWPCEWKKPAKLTTGIAHRDSTNSELFFLPTGISEQSDEELGRGARRPGATVGRLMARVIVTAARRQVTISINRRSPRLTESSRIVGLILPNKPDAEYVNA